MKRIIQILIAVLFFSGHSKAQCSASFLYYNLSGGVVSFSSTSSGTINSSSTYTWSFGSQAIPNNTTGVNIPNINATYTSNGTFTVNLGISTGTTFCSVSQTISVNTVTTPCIMVAGFTYTQAGNGLVNFGNLTTGASAGTNYLWNYGDGISNGFSTHTYTANGIYTVSLVATNTNVIPTCTSSSSQTLAVASVTTPCNLAASFNYTQAANGQVGFSNVTTGAMATTSYSWSYGDGSAGILSTHNYSANGIYTVTLIATNNNVVPSCQSSKTQTILINSYCSLSASFSYTLPGDTNTLFNSTSVGTTTGTVYYWFYGDGDTTMSTSSSVVHTYSTYGVYTATLTITQLLYGQLCSSSAVHTFTIYGGCNLTANLSHTLNAAAEASFVSTSSGTNSNTSYYWDFGDGFYSTGFSSVTHTYSSNGTHYVQLKINDGNFPACRDSLVQAINVTGATCLANSNFNLSPVSGTPQHWNATPVYPWNVVDAEWAWGDGTSSSALYTSHTYSAAGNYSVCLSVTVSCGAISSSCAGYYLYKSNEDAANIIYINVVKPVLILTGVENETKSEEINCFVFPNPNSGEFNLLLNNLPAEKTKIEVCDMVGKIIYEETNESNMGVLEKMVNLKEIENGIYFFKVWVGNTSISKKIIVNH